ncbi:hypothetical protein Fmac_009118 [Flemingia macrophylla]|uniref:BRCT domain-containing protein n=1 Tax=Flemingia macrophylla TaxID=520843 RepID=A0ABD1N0H9_9FABA
MSLSGSMGKDDRRIHADFDYVDTQPLNTDCEEDDDNECRHFEDTVPFDDNVLETQVVDLAGETQPLDDMDTQLLEEESESGGTQVLENVNDGVFVDETQCVDSDNGQPLDTKKTDSSQQNSSGSMPPRYTFLRAESLRQAALANRNMNLKQTQDVTNDVPGMKDFCQEPLSVKDNGEPFPRCSEKVGGFDKENEHGKYTLEFGDLKSKSMCKIANSTVRKLFNDELRIEANGPSLGSNDFNDGDGLDKLPNDHYELGGLSYINSQEPGLLSQDNALNFVDRFLKDNIMELDEETNCVKNIKEKSNSIPSTKGQQGLAKRVNDKGKAGRTGIYDWDDSCEDEGGGDIYIRRKEDFFKGETHGARSLPVFQKSKMSRLNIDKKDEKQLSVPNQRKTAGHSDSRLGMHVLKVMDNIMQEATVNLKRNLANELDEQFNTDCSRGEKEPNANEGVQEMLDIGLDTQMAAEAMEALAEDIVDCVATDATHVTRSGLTYKLNNTSTGQMRSVSSKEHLGQYDRKKRVDVKSKLRTSGLSKKSSEIVRQCKMGNMMAKSKRCKLNSDGNQISSADENGRVSLSPIIVHKKSSGALKRYQLDELNNSDGNIGEDGVSPAKKRQLHDNIWHFTPVARRTRRSLAIPSKSMRDGDIGIDSLEKSSGIALQASKSLNSNSTGSSDHFEVDDNSKSSQFKNSALKASAVSVSDDVEMGALDCPKRRRSLRIRNLSSHDKGSETSVGLSKRSVQPEDIGKSTARKRKIRTDSVVISTDGSVTSLDKKQRKISELNFGKVNLGNNINSSEVTGSDESPRERDKSSDLASATPAKFKTPVNNASPVCMGDEYYKQSCNRNLSSSCLLKESRKDLNRELQSLSAIRPELLTPSKDSRKRRDMTDVRILYSHHLDEDIIKHQRKILARLGVSVASSIADATHFIADQFVRTRNLLEAIASGKPVVTHLWIESCGQASCFIDERNYILRDAQKEKEIGFSMPVSLARAIHHPLLEGRRVLITPNTKPSKEILSNLARAVQGQVVEKVGRSTLKGHKIADDLLILSCEEDYASCVPFLEKGAMVYSSELLLNGIVTQKLVYQRHRLFADNVKKTRSTLWFKRDDKTFVPVTKCN